MRRLITGDWHVIDGREAEPCDRDLVRRLVAEAVASGVGEVILAGDIIDITRGGDGCIPQAALFLGQAVGVPLGAAGIYCTYIFGNHDWIGAKTSAVVHAMVDAGFAPLQFRSSTGPEFRGPWQIEHGHRFDPWNRGGLVTHVAEAATRVDAVLDQAGVDIETLDPRDWHLKQGVSELDLPIHREANRWAAGFGRCLVFGHSHARANVRGCHDGVEWRVLNPGAMVKGSAFSYAWITDEGDGGLKGGSVMAEELGVVKIPNITWGAGIRSASALDFSEATRTAIDNALRDVPSGHSTAVLELNLKGLQAIVATKQPLWGEKAQWTIGAYVGKAWSGPVDAGVRLSFSF